MEHDRHGIHENLSYNRLYFLQERSSARIYDLNIAYCVPKNEVRQKEEQEKLVERIEPISKFDFDQRTSFPQAKRVGNPSENQGDSGQAGMTSWFGSGS